MTTVAVEISIVGFPQHLEPFVTIKSDLLLSEWWGGGELKQREKNVGEYSEWDLSTLSWRESGDDHETPRRSRVLHWLRVGQGAN